MSWGAVVLATVLLLHDSTAQYFCLTTAMSSQAEGTDSPGPVSPAL